MSESTLETPPLGRCCGREEDERARARRLWLGAMEAIESCARHLGSGAVGPEFGGVLDAATALVGASLASLSGAEVAALCVLVDEGVLGASRRAGCALLAAVFASSSRSQLGQALGSGALCAKLAALDWSEDPTAHSAVCEVLVRLLSRRRDLGAASSAALRDACPSLVEQCLGCLKRGEADDSARDASHLRATLKDERDAADLGTRALRERLDAELGANKDLRVDCDDAMAARATAKADAAEALNRLDAYDAALALRPTFPEARSDAGLHISPVSPMYLPYISPISHLYLAYISHLPRGALQRRRSLTLASNASL